jgi:two-component system NtrC family sensor kinase
VDPEHAHSKIERQLLESLASHASVALENLRLFSRIEQSRKQWVEDFDAISDLIVVHGADGRILRLNRALADHLGMPLTEAIGCDMGAFELFASTAQLGGCPFCRTMETEQGDFSHQASGRTYIVSTSRIHGGEGSELRTIHVLKDITEKREAERLYRHEHDFNRNILNNSQSMILVLDASGIVRYANRRCYEVGYRESGLLDRSLIELVATPRRPQFVEALERALQGNTVNNLELPLLHSDGKIRQFSISLSPMRDEQGGIHSVVVMMTDITDATDLQSKLIHTEKLAALGQLVSGVAHEVNNPLAAIVGFTDLLLEDPQILPEAKDELRVILQEAQRTRVIVQNLLSFARQMPPQQEPVEINSLLQQTLKLRSYDLVNHGVELTENLEKNLPLVVGDSHQLQQVFLNILNNAYDAVREVKRSGRIEIATARRDGHLEILFQDNGPGIAHPERIFDPFFTTKEVGKGTGLGLSICYGIVRSHRGEIAARNNADGVGCTFVLRLPVANQAMKISATEEGLR